MNNLTKRILVGIVGIPLIIAVSYFGGLLFLIFSIIVSSIALWEFYGMLETKGLKILKVGAVLAAGLLLISTRFILPEYFFILIAIFFMSIEIFRTEDRHPLNPVVTIFGILYITVPFLMLYFLTGFRINIVIIIFILIWTCDTMAYFGGRLLGKHKLSVISPNKTVEGSVIGFIFTVAVAVLMHYTYFEELSLRDSIVTGVIVGIFSQVGDLFESFLKRYCDVKDSSDIIPGHGGVLDRFDSLIFVTPVIFIYFNLISATGQ